MADLTTLTDDELLDKIIDELELSARQPEHTSNKVYHDRCANVHLYEMVARLASECGALRSRMNQQYEMIVQLEKRLDSQTNEEQPDQHEPTVEASAPMQIVTAEIDTSREQQVKQEQMVQEINQSQTETDEGILLYDSDRENVISMRTDEQPRRIDSLPDKCNEERHGFMARWNNVSLEDHYKSDEHGNVNQSLRMTQPTATMVDSIARIITDDGLSNTITEIERTDQQTAEQFNDAYHNKHCSVHPVVKQEQTVEASSPMEVEICSTVMSDLLPLNISSQSKQHQEFVSQRDASSAVEIKELLKQLQIFIPDRQRMNPQVMLREAHQLHLTEMSAVHDEATIKVTDSTQLQTNEMETTNELSTLSDSTQMEEVSKSDTLRLSTEECSDRDDIIATSCNVSIDVEQEKTMPSPQMKACSVRIRKIDATQIRSNSVRSKAPSKNPENTRRTHSCSECNKRFMSNSHLIRHSRVHTGEKPYVCTDCGAAFTAASSLKTHQRIHSGEKPFVCTDCGTAFNQSQNLKAHQRIHLGEKPFICDICKASFRLKRELSLHMGIHSGKKSYKCNVCKLEFRMKLSLKRHLNVHIGLDVRR